MELCGFQAGLEYPLFLIAGPCVIESRQLALDTAGALKEITDRLGVPFIYKSSYDKANRSSAESYRGPGLEEGLDILDEVKRQIGVPVLTDVHEDTPLGEVAAVVDVLQTPAFLCRQTNFIQNVARQGLPVNIKKGQFLAPWDMKNVVDKARAVGNERILVCERGVSFGYNNLVSDMRALAVMRDGRRWPPGSPGCSWRPTPIPTAPFPTGPMPGPWGRWRGCWRPSWASTAGSRRGPSPRIRYNRAPFHARTTNTENTKGALKTCPSSATSAAARSSIARQPHRRGGRPPRRRVLRSRGGPLRRLHRHPRGGGAARR